MLMEHLVFILELSWTYQPQRVGSTHQACYHVVLLCTILKVLLADFMSWHLSIFLKKSFAWARDSVGQTKRKNKPGNDTRE